MNDIDIEIDKATRRVRRWRKLFWAAIAAGVVIDVGAVVSIPIAFGSNPWLLGVIVAASLGVAVLTRRFLRRLDMQADLRALEKQRDEAIQLSPPPPPVPAVPTVTVVHGVAYPHFLAATSGALLGGLLVAASSRYGRVVKLRKRRIP